MLRGLAESSLDLVEIEATQIDRRHLERIHDPSYVEMVEAFCSMGGGALDMDTIVSPRSWTAALTAAGGVVDLIEELETRSDATGFAVTRPPGHHALRDRAMGFCLFNNVAVAAAKLKAEGRRVAILDWDVHHGNGTESMLGRDEDILYVSLHQSPFYPFEGMVEAIDESPGEGTVINIPLIEGTAGDVYREAWASIVLPAVEQFAPDWVLVSAGFDANHSDPLAGLKLIPDDYGWMTDRLRLIHPSNRTLFALEGGYDLDALRDSTRATVEGMKGEFAPGPPLASAPGAGAALEATRSAVARHFSI